MESLCIVNITLKFECAYNNAGLSTFYRTVAAVCLEVRTALSLETYITV
jgi:hypothetical protein